MARVDSPPLVHSLILSAGDKRVRRRFTTRPYGFFFSISSCRFFFVFQIMSGEQGVPLSQAEEKQRRADSVTRNVQCHGELRSVTMISFHTRNVLQKRSKVAKIDVCSCSRDCGTSNRISSKKYCSSMAIARNQIWACRLPTKSLWSPTWTSSFTAPPRSL